jgi:hypothetical protein
MRYHTIRHRIVKRFFEYHTVDRMQSRHGGIKQGDSKNGPAFVTPSMTTARQGTGEFRVRFGDHNRFLEGKFGDVHEKMVFWRMENAGGNAGRTATL